MRILHTSDWHLGRLFHRSSLLDVQAQALDRIIEIVRDQKIDLVVIAGDLYDRAIPPSDAVDLFDDALIRIRDAGALVIAIGGNHDSPSRVGYGDRLLARVGVTVRGDIRRAAEPVEIDANDGGPPVVVYPIPYLDPLAVSSLSRTSSEEAASAGVETTSRRRFTHQDAIEWALTRARVDLAGRDARSVVVAHTFVDGATESESEREITVGNIDHVSSSSFADFNYVALGHIHKSQGWQQDRVAYSGTPLPYSFSEQDHTKSVRIIDLATDGSIQVEVVPLGVGRSLRTITGDLEALLKDPLLVEAEQAWVRVRLTDSILPLQAMSRLQARFPNAVELRHEPAAAEGQSDKAIPTRAELESLTPLDRSLKFLDDQRGFPAENTERQLLVDAISARSGSES